MGQVSEEGEKREKKREKQRENERRVKETRREDRTSHGWREVKDLEKEEETETAREAKAEVDE